jgi:hypothetical protein
VPYEEYQRLVEEAEMLQDIRDYDEVKLSIASRAEELIPSEVTYALLDGENPILVRMLSGQAITTPFKPWSKAEVSSTELVQNLSKVLRSVQFADFPEVVAPDCQRNGHRKQPGPAKKRP